MKFKRLLLSIIAPAILLLSSCDFSFLNREAIVLKESSVTLNIGVDGVYTSQIVPSIKNPKEDTEYTFVYASSTPTVAIVNSSGFVTGKSVGDTNIIVYLAANTSISTKYKVHVVDHQPVEIKIDQEPTEIPISRTMQLSATVKYTADRNVTWSSSDESKATVDKNGLVYIPETANVGDKVKIFATSNYDETVSASIELTIKEKPNFKYDYTIMFYMSGSNLEYDGTKGSGYGGASCYPGLFTQDIREILSVSNMPDRVKIIIETGGTKKWGMPASSLDGTTSMSAKNLQRWEVSNGKLKLIETLSTNALSTEASFESFLKWGLKDYEAEQMGVVLSGHGGGADGCLYDDNTNESLGQYSSSASLNASEIAEACKNALATSSKVNKFTWIGYDCCIMSVADNATVNADYFDYMVSSQESESGTGWNHDVYLPLLYENPLIEPEDFLPQISKSFLDDNHSKSESYRCYQTSAVLNLKNINSLVDSFNEYMDAVGCDSKTYSSFLSAFNKSYNAFGESVYGLADFVSFLNQLAKIITTQSVDKIIKAIKEVVIANYYCSYYSTLPCGLNIFFPKSNDKSYALQVAKINYSGQNSTKFVDYQQMCLNYGSWEY